MIKDILSDECPIYFMRNAFLNKSKDNLISDKIKLEKELLYAENIVAYNTMEISVIDWVLATGQYKVEKEVT